MAQQKIKFSLRYTITGFFSGLTISIITFIIIIYSANLNIDINEIFSFFAENSIIFTLGFIPLIMTIIIGYITDLNIDNLLKSKFAEFDEEKEHSHLIFNIIEKLIKGESLENIKDLPEEDKIIKSLKNLSEEIEKRQKEQEKRKKEDEQRAKTSEGLAYFGAVLREYNENIEVLTKNLINELVKYTGAYQAAFYLLDDTNPDDIKIKEVANFASGRKKLANKELKFGEGLIGACIVEKKSNYLKNISENYMEIESGLGHSKPKSILIVPVVTQEGVIHGAIEIASFKEYENYEIEFMEQIAENTAITISTLKINEETTRLLKESQEQASMLSSREDELQKTISEMKRLQDNADIQSAAFRSYQDATNNALVRAEFTTEGKLLFANRKFLKLFEYKSNSEIEGELITKFINTEQETWFDNMKEKILKQNIREEGLIKYITKTGKTIWIESAYTGLRNEKGKTEKILFFGIDATKLKTDIQNLELKINKINNTLHTIEFSPNGEITEIAEHMLNKLMFDKNEIKNKKINDIIPETNTQTFKNIIEKLLISDENFEGEIDFLKKNGENIRFYGNMFVIKNINDNIENIKFTGYDYSQQIEFAEKIKEQEKIIENKIKENETLKERMTRRVEQVREEMRELYLDIETAYLFGRQTLDLLPQPVITINKDNNIEFINNSAAKNMNIDYKEMLGKNIKELFPDPENKPEGKYIGDILDIDNEELSDIKKHEVFIIDENGKPVKYKMLPIKVSVGLRKQLSIFLEK